MTNERTRRDLLVTLAALLLLTAWEASGWDMALAAWYGQASGFALRDDWWTRRLLHDGGRILAGIALAACALLAWHGLGSAAARRVRATWFALVLSCLLLIPALKRASATSCPWDLQAFGGAVPYVPHWMPGVQDGGPGHCFPSGHAVAAFAFLPLYFQWRVQRPRLALALLSIVLALGALFGWAQLARGAHFASHTLWSAWLCWTVGAAGAWCIERAPRTQPASRLSISRVRPSLAAASATTGSPLDGVPSSLQSRSTT